MNPDSDFAAMLRALNDAEAEYLLVGGYAVAFHGEPRYTKDMNLWVRPHPDNAQRVWRALAAFGALLTDLTQADLATPGIVFQIGIEPVRIDILTSVDPLSFSDAATASVSGAFAGVPIRIIGRDHLMAAKRYANRLQDRIDV
jgi:predicted nucleotidyltransferase